MRRRDFSSGLISAGLGGAAVTTGGLILPGRSFATTEQEERESGRLLDPFGRVELRFAARVVVLTWLLIFLQSGLLGIDLRRPIPQFNENRVNTGNVPFLGDLFRPLIGSRFADAALVGFLVLYGAMLFLIPHGEQRLQNRKVVIAHRDRSWEAQRRTATVRMNPIPGLSELSSLLRIGAAYQKNRELLFLIRPAIFDDQFDD